MIMFLCVSTCLFLSNSGILEEAEFYNITDLIVLIKDKIRERNAKQNQVSKVKDSIKVTLWLEWYKNNWIENKPEKIKF